MSDLQESLISMGFAKSDVVIALERTNNDVDLAISMLTSGRVNAEPDEFGGYMAYMCVYICLHVYMCAAMNAVCYVVLDIDASYSNMH